MVEKQTFGERLATALFSRFPFVAERWAKKFKAQRVEGTPWTPFEKELSRCKVAIVTTAGVHLNSQQPFDMEDVDGDPTFREVPRDASKSDITITHKYYDHTDADKDINILFPIDRLLEMKERGEIGEVAESHYSFMGHILGRHLKTLIEETGPEAARKLKSSGVDVALLTPGWGVCNQSVGLIQREIEKAGIPTISVTILRKLTEEVKPPRAVFLRWPFGHPLGEPFNIPQQTTILREAFKALKEIKDPGAIIDLPYRWRREKYKM